MASPILSAPTARIVVDQITLPAGDPETFEFELVGTSGDEGVARQFELTDEAEPHDSNALGPGRYTLIQRHRAPTWDLTRMECDDGSAVDAIELERGETVRCTFVNTKRAEIHVDLVTHPLTTGHWFSFMLSGGPAGLRQIFSLADEDPPHRSGPVLPGAGYTIEETVPADWLLTSSECDDGSPVDAIVLDPGELVTCTFVNAPLDRRVVHGRTADAVRP